MTLIVGTNGQFQNREKNIENKWNKWRNEKGAGTENQKMEKKREEGN